jgi:hypothetical protein
MNNVAKFDSDIHAVMIRSRHVMCMSRGRRAGSKQQYTRTLARAIATDRTTTVSRLLASCRAVRSTASAPQTDRSQVVEFGKTTSVYFSNFLRTFACRLNSAAMGVTPGTVTGSTTARLKRFKQLVFDESHRRPKIPRCGSTCTSPLGDSV